MAGGIMVILDGLDDIPYIELQNKTPLESGKRESFKTIENSAITGRFQTTPEDLKADTMVGVLSLLGVTAKEMPLGRSYLEAIAKEIPFGENDLILRGNFVKISAQGKLQNAFAIPSEDTVKAITDQFAKHNFVLYPIGEYRNIIVVKDSKEHLKGLQTYEPHQNIGGDLKDTLPKGNIFSQRLAKLSNEIYSQTNGYTVLPWGQSIFQNLPQLSVKAAVVHNTSVVTGIAKLMGIRNATKKTFTGETDTDLHEKAKTAIALLKEYPLVVVHIAGTDEATHRKDPTQKAEFIQRIDKELLGYILSHLKDEEKLLVTSDHWALCKTGGHTTDPVGFYLYQKNLQPKDIGMVSDKPPYALIFGNLK